jgi:hypothetical protein
VTFKVITRGAPRPILSEFLCPLHGRFTALVDSGADEAPCPVTVGPGAYDEHGRARNHTPCAWPSPWSPSKVPAMRMKRVEATRGNHEKAEHKGWLDTTNLEEVHEELRKELVMEALRSD